MYYIYLVRYGEYQDVEYGFVDGFFFLWGQCQVELIVDWFLGLLFDVVWYLLLFCVNEMVCVIVVCLFLVDFEFIVLLFDCVFIGMIEEIFVVFELFFGLVIEVEIEVGCVQMVDVVNEFLVCKMGDVYEVFIMYNFVIFWFVCEVFVVFEWWWMMFNQLYCGLMVIVQKQGWLWMFLMYNDIGYLLVEFCMGIFDVLLV